MTEFKTSSDVEDLSIGSVLIESDGARIIKVARDMWDELYADGWGKAGENFPTNEINFPAKLGEKGERRRLRDWEK